MNCKIHTKILSTMIRFDRKDLYLLLGVTFNFFCLKMHLLKKKIIHYISIRIFSLTSYNLFFIFLAISGFHNKIKISSKAIDSFFDFFKILKVYRTSNNMVHAFVRACVCAKQYLENIRDEIRFLIQDNLIILLWT